MQVWEVAYILSFSKLIDMNLAIMIPFLKHDIFIAYVSL